MNDLGVETTWVVIEGSDRFFNVTKAVHNALQGAETHLDDDMRETYWERMHANAAELPDDFDVVVVHDPQPAALLQVLDESSRRKGKWIWRCHIDLSAPYRPVWDFFEPVVNRYDAAIFTAEEYVQPGVQGTGPGVHPALDRPAQPEERADDGVHLAGRPGAVRRGSRTPLVTQVSRFDPWKDPLGVIDAFRLIRREVPDAQLALVGSLAHDDPEASGTWTSRRSTPPGNPTSICSRT